jgi:hypothetical protein
MGDQVSHSQNNILELPAFAGAPALRLEMDRIVEAEKRYHEVKTVNPITYVDLEHSFNESYRELKRHLSSIGFHITIVEKTINNIKADILLGPYAEFMKGKPKSHDNADLRNAFMIKDAGYSAALDRLNQLKAFESHFEGKLKVVENVCRYMRQQMYLISKGGALDPNLYPTAGKK